MGSLDPVIIIGAGLGGLAFARGLHKASIPFKVFERGEPITSSSQGYRIRLISQGVSALRYLLDDRTWQTFEETCPDIHLDGLPTINAVTCEINDADFRGSDPRNRMESSHEKPYNADRAVLREVLLTGLEDHIAFEKKFSHYRLTESGVNAFFTDGTKVAGSLLVGADGARSAVRQQYLPNFKLLDTRNRIIYGKTPLTLSLTSRILPEALKRLSFIKDPQAGSLTLIEALHFLPKSQRIGQHDLPHDYMYWTIIPPPGAYPVAEKKVKRIDGEGAADAALTTTKAWHPSLKLMIENQDRSQTGVYGLLSVDPESLLRGWQPNGHVTILGDAAHAMMPSEGNGTGTALRDAALLVRMIRDHGVGPRSVALYEGEMRQYASEAVIASAKVGGKVFGFGSLEDAVEVH